MVPPTKPLHVFIDAQFFSLSFSRSKVRSFYEFSYTILHFGIAAKVVNCISLLVHIMLKVEVEYCAVYTGCLTLKSAK